MRRTRRNPPPPRTPEEREAARAERERRRAARHGEPPPDERRQPAEAAGKRPGAIPDWSSDDWVREERRGEPPPDERRQPAEAGGERPGAIHDWSTDDWVRRERGAVPDWSSDDWAREERGAVPDWSSDDWVRRERAAVPDWSSDDWLREERAAVPDWSRSEPLPDDPLLPPPATVAAGASTRRRPSGRARNTVIFSVLTGFSRVAGLAREIVARSYFGTSGAMSAFTLAFQVPNLVRALVADAALSSAFVPVFSELLEHKRRREALQLASALAGLLLVALGALTLAFIALAPVIMPLFTGSESTPAIDDLTVGLSQVLFPIVVLLGLNGLVVGILNAHEHFTIPALAPLVWNLVIIGGLVGLTPLFEGDDQLYAYAIGVLAGTVVQLVMCLPQLRRSGYPLRFSFAFRHDPRVRRVLLLMLPVSLGIGLINVSLLINSAIGFLVSEEAPTAIDAAFRIYMLPQGMFSVAVTTVLFPALSRLAARRDVAGLRALIGSGMRQIAFLLIPSAAAFVALSTPIVRLVYQRGDFDAESTRQVSEALFWFAFSLPLSGLTLLLTRSFFSLQRPWLPTQLAIWSLAVNAVVALALYKPFGIGGIVIGTAVSNLVLTLLEGRRLRQELRGLEVARTLKASLIIALASALLGAVAYGAWYGLDSLLGRSLIAQLISVGAALALGGLVYVAVLLRSGLPEARQIVDLFARRLRRSPS